jgi:hypothetical protein
MGGVREVLPAGRMVRHTYLGGILPTSAVASKLWKLQNVVVDV